MQPADWCSVFSALSSAALIEVQHYLQPDWPGNLSSVWKPFWTVTHEYCIQVGIIRFTVSFVLMVASTTPGLYFIIIDKIFADLTNRLMDCIDACDKVCVWERCSMRIFFRNNTSNHQEHHIRQMHYEWAAFSDSMVIALGSLIYIRNYIYIRKLLYGYYWAPNLKELDKSIYIFQIIHFFLCTVIYCKGIIKFGVCGIQK